MSLFFKPRQFPLQHNSLSTQMGQYDQYIYNGWPSYSEWGLKKSCLFPVTLP